MKKVYVEIGHAYANDFCKDQTRQAIDIFKQHYSKNKRIVQPCFLIDEYNCYTAPKHIICLEKNIYQYFDQYDINNLLIGKESYMVQWAELFIEQIFKNYIKTRYFKKEDKYVDFYINGKDFIKIKQKKDIETHYSCAFLSFIWHLKRSQSFYINRENQLILSSNRNKEIISILPKKYESIENQVGQLLSFVNYKNKCLFF